SDTLPAGLVISTPNNLVGICGGGTITATQATNVISLSGATLAQSSFCSFSVNVTGMSAGTKNNTTGAITSTEGGTGATSNTAVLTVVAPPSIAKLFSPSSIALNATTSLQFTITNPVANTVALTGVAFGDTLPGGLTAVNGTSSVCGGANNLVVSGGNTITLSNTTIAAGGPCQLNGTVTGAASGQDTKTQGRVQSTNGGTGNTATANLTVASPPAITKAFSGTVAIAASPTGATESGNTVTITTVGANGFTAGQLVSVVGVGVAGYNGTFV